MTRAPGGARLPPPSLSKALLWEHVSTRAGPKSQFWFSKTNRDVTNVKLTWWVKRGFGPESSVSLLGCFHLTYSCGMFTATDSSNTSYTNPPHRTLLDIPSVASCCTIASQNCIQVLASPGMTQVTKGMQLVNELEDHLQGNDSTDVSPAP